MWILYAILSYISYGFSSTIDRYYMKNHYNPYSMSIFKMFFNGVLLSMALLFLDKTFLFSPWAILMGAIYAGATVLYMKAMQIEESSTVIPTIQTGKIILTTTFGVFFFLEKFSIITAIGIIISILGVYLIMFKGHHLSRQKSLGFLIGNFTLASLYWIIAKIVLENISPLDIGITVYLSSSLFILLFSYKKVKLQTSDLRIFPASIFGALGTYLILTALSSGDISKITPLSGIQTVTIFLLGVILLKEKITLKKISGTLCVIVGIYLISLTT